MGDPDRVKIGPRIPRWLKTRIDIARAALGTTIDKIVEEALSDWLLKHRQELQEAGIAVGVGDSSTKEEQGKGR